MKQPDIKSSYEGDKTSALQNDAILKKQPWAKKYLRKSPIIQLRVVRLEPNQMVKPRETKPHHALDLVDKEGRVICKIGEVINKKRFSFWDPSTWRKSIEVKESIEEALLRLSESECNNVAFGVERYFPCTYDPDINLFIYKTPSGYENFADFIFKTLAEARASLDDSYIE